MRSRFAAVTLFSSLALVSVACGSSNDASGTTHDGDASSPVPGDVFRNDDAGTSSGGDGAIGPACATAQAAAARQPVYVDLVLDGSRSMDGHGGPTTAVPCDLSADTDHEASSCFLVNAREPDPEAPQRDIYVCHQEDNSDTHGLAQSKCPGFIGLTGKKWLAARGAIDAYVDALAASPNAKIGVGFFLFSSTDVKSPTTWDVPVAMVDATQAGRIKARIAPGTWPAGGTPLESTIKGQAALMRAFAPAAPLESGGTRVMVLMTDGVPNGSSTKQAVADAVTAARNATPALTTFVVGIGDPSADESTVYDEKFLSALAVAGGGAPAGCNPAWDGENPNGTAPCHLQVTPGTKSAAQIRAEIAAAIDAVAASAQSCELSLTETATIDPTRVNVVYRTSQGAESQVPADASNGWTYDDPSRPTKVILHGTSCDALKADPNGSVQIVIGCLTGTPIR